MKLYDVPRNTMIYLSSDESKQPYKFCHIDGMYSYCKNEAGDVVHFAAWADVIIVGDN
jgi:hypothetical protein